MDEQTKIVELVTLAQSGQTDARDELVRDAESKIRAYIYRVTLDLNLTDDLVQESVLSMIKSLNTIKDSARFYGWLYSMAERKINQHYRDVQRRAAISASVFYGDVLGAEPADSSDEGLRKMLQKELSKAVMKAFGYLERPYRAVLSMRVFDRLSYDDIAVALGCSRIGARVMFVRAKRALKKQLSRQGLDKSLLVLGLGLFVKATASADAAAEVVVTPAATKAGFTAAALGIVTSKLGMGTMAAGVLIVAAWTGNVIFSGSVVPARSQIKSLHYTVQARNINTGTMSSLSTGAFEQQTYFPDGVDGPVLRCIQRWDPAQTQRLCTWLENEQANYYYSSVENCVYINNYRFPGLNLEVVQLPTDPPLLADFIAQVTGSAEGINYTRDAKTGLLVKSVDRRFLDTPLFQTDYTYNTVYREQFQCNWPTYSPVTDNRDKMRKRGWTWLRLTGLVAGKKIEGRAQVPFVYAAMEHYPWICLRIGDNLEVVDCRKGACVRRPDGTELACYPAGAFFKGFPRPWMGMHTIDTVRRDAARQQIWFDTVWAANTEDIIVTLIEKHGYDRTSLAYKIGFKDDLISSIKFNRDDNVAGSLELSYLQDIDGLDAEFTEPTLPDKPQRQIQAEPGVRWLFKLLRGGLEG